MESRGGHALLLRLFASSFFNVHLALSYLKTYPDSIGITHYLVKLLRSFDAAEVEFYWPQLLYLVITRPTPSVALENFVLERCEEDPHVAVITLWYLQSFLSDLAINPTSSQFAVCGRVYNRVQSIIFTDPPIPTSSSPTSSSSFLSALSPRKREKVNAPLAAFVGLGVMAASIVMPGLALEVGPVAVEQGRRVEEMERQRISADGGEEGSGSESGSEDEPPRAASATNGKQAAPPVVAGKVNGILKNKVVAALGPKRSQTQPALATSPSYLPGPRLEATPPSPLSSPLATQHQSHSLSFLPSRLPSSRSPLSSSSSSIFEKQRNGPTPPRPKAGLQPSFSTTSPFPSPSFTSQSSPSIPFTSQPSATHSASYLLASPLSSVPTDSTLPGYGFPKPFLAHLLRLQAQRSQLDLLRSLQDISTRLVLVPKPARLSSLRAELTVLNHGLPRGCCLGMACEGTSFPSSESGGKKTRAHARIVRISPSESVVLNSADRAPFVIYVEVLDGDLDFDPDRRQNVEDLRRALKERETGGAVGIVARGGAVGSKAGRKSLESGMELGKRSEAVESVEGEGSNKGQDSSGSGDISTSISKDGGAQVPPSPPVVEPPKEVDLVEQLYGDISIHEAPMAPIADPTIQNRSVDEQAWLPRAASQNPTPTPSPTSSSISAIPSRPSLPSAGRALARPGGRTVSARQVISLDDYAERMRMAAIMLAQLDASQAESAGVIATGTAAAGTLVGLPVATVAGIGGVVGGVVGAGFGAVASAFHRRDVQAGQSSTGVVAALDTASAAAGTSSVAGAPPLAPAGRPSASTLSPSAPLPPSQRQRVLAAGEATAIRNRIMAEMLALEEERMERMREDGRARSGWATGSGVEDGAVVMRAVNKDDPSGAVFAESFASKTSRIRAASPYGHLASWNVISVIVKTGADLRQEQLAIQLVKEFGRIWNEEKCPSWVRYFRILVTSESSGLIETITDAVSVHSIKKDAYARTAADGTQVFKSFTLYNHYVEAYGSPTTSAFRKAQDAFIKSLASYSVICYLLQLKDRHNGNILIDREGHVIHIDFGFLLSNSPGSLGFEAAPFKLPQDYIDILGGFEGEKYAEFKALFKRSFRDARKHAERIITLVELMQKDSKLPCFANGDLTSQQLRERFQLSLTQSQVDDFVEKLFLHSAVATSTRLYDLFQGYSNGIL